MTAQSVENGSEHDACHVTIQEKAVTTWLFDTDADAHVVPNCAWEQLGEPMLQTKVLHRAEQMDKTLEPWKKFKSKVKVQFTAVVARDARRCLLSGTQISTQGHTFTLNQHESFTTQPKGSQRVTMTREGNRDTLKNVRLLKPRDAQSVTSLMLKRELESVRRELRNLKTGQHVNKRENVEGERTADEKLLPRESGMPHMIRDAKRVSKCEECQRIHERQLRKLHLSTMQQSRTVNKVHKSRSWLVLDRMVKRLREPYIERVQNSKISSGS